MCYRNLLAMGSPQRSQRLDCSRTELASIDTLFQEVESQFVAREAEFILNEPIFESQDHPKVPDT